MKFKIDTMGCVVISLIWLIEYLAAEFSINLFAGCSSEQTQQSQYLRVE